MKAHLKKNPKQMLKSWYAGFLPTLLIWGKKDSFLRHEMAHQSIGRCKEGLLEMIQDAAHWVHHEKPQQVNALIYDFVR